MHTIPVLTFVLTAAASQTPAAKKTEMLADADARPKLALTLAAKPMRLEEPPASGTEMMQVDREKVAAQPEVTGKPVPMPEEPKPPAF